MSNRKFFLRAKRASVAFLAFVFVFITSQVGQFMPAKAAAPVANDDFITTYTNPVLIDPASLIANDENTEGMSLELIFPDDVPTAGYSLDVRYDGKIEFINYLPNRAETSFKYKLSSSGPSDASLDGDAGKTVYYFGGHYYVIIDSIAVWEDAAARATLMKINKSDGSVLQNGHLVEIDSEEENDFLVRHVLGNSFNTNPVWTRGNDKDTEGTWRWGSESEQIPGEDKIFWEGGPNNSSTSTDPAEKGSPVTGVYHNWSAGDTTPGSGEPNNVIQYNFGNLVDEDCLSIDQYGNWYDEYCGNYKRYIVEFADDSVTDPTTVESNEATVTIITGSSDNLSCTSGGVKATWSGSAFDVLCGGNYISNINGVEEITLSGVATDVVTFVNDTSINPEDPFTQNPPNYVGPGVNFKKLNIDGVTDNYVSGGWDCQDNYGCLMLDIETNDLEINTLRYSRVYLASLNTGDTNFVGSGKLEIPRITNDNPNSVMNFYSDIKIGVPDDSEFTHTRLLSEGKVNILNGNFDVLFNGNDDGNGHMVLFAKKGLSISNEAKVTIDLNNLSDNKEARALYLEGILGLGDLVVARRDGVELGRPTDMASYLVGSSDRVVFGFAAEGSRAGEEGTGTGVGTPNTGADMFGLGYLNKGAVISLLVTIATLSSLAIVGILSNKSIKKQ